jgi:hypothetical protein
MKTLLPSRPPERLIESGETDGMNSLRALRDEYEKRGDMRAASAISIMIGDTAVADESILSEVTITPEDEKKFWDAMSKPLL